MGQEFVDACNQARAKYLPIELDHNISHEEKEKAMTEWWDITQENIKKVKPTKNDIRVIMKIKNRNQLLVLTYILETVALNF